jgi:hypothetical protein
MVTFFSIMLSTGDEIREVTFSNFIVIQAQEKKSAPERIPLTTSS